MKKLSALLVLVAACAESPTEVSSAPGAGKIQLAAAGAVVEHDNVQESGCYDLYDGQLCYTMDGVLQVVTTPAGNTTYYWNGDYTTDYSYNNMGTHFEGSDQTSNTTKYHFHDGEDHEFGWKDSGQLTETVNGVTMNCTWESRYHYANGKVTQEDFQITCT